MAPQHKDWTREEHILAFNLYCKIPFGSIGMRNPKIIQLAKILGRSIGAVSYKLANFSRLDPELQARGIKGMPRGAKGEEDIWREFENNSEALAFESERLLAQFTGRKLEEIAEIDERELPKEGLERERMVRTRVNQHFFRAAVLSAYDNKCCVTGLAIPKLLVASLYKPGFKINSKLILAAVHLDRRASDSLIEKTNREGFVDNEAYKTLVAAITYTLGVIEEYRHEDKEKVRNFYGLSPKSEPVLANIAELKNVVETRVKDAAVQKECLKYLDRIENDYKEIHEILLTSAEAGLNLGVAIHEIEKIILELKRVIAEEHTPQKVVKLIRHLAGLIEMYGNLLRRSKQKNEQLKTLIDDALLHTEYRLKAHKIQVVKDFNDFRGDSTIKCSGRLVIGSILNIIDNSIYWLERAQEKQKKIYISLKKQSSHHLEILIADNGRGFAMPAAQMVKPFVSLKPGGMGLGLHIVSEVMTAQGGAILFPKYTETDLPSVFSNGAIIGLSFKKEVEP